MVSGLAFSVDTVTRVLRCIASSSAARGFCLHRDGFSLELVDSSLRHLKTSVSPSVVALKTSFISPEKTPICLHATGIFLEPGLIATAARSVGRVATSYEPRPAEKPDRFDHGVIRHKPEIGTTVALTAAGKTLETKPLAVSFSSDVAVLKAVNGETFPHCTLAKSHPRKDDILVSIPHLGDFDSEPVGVFGRVRTTEERTSGEKPPWPMEDRSGWVEHDWLKYSGGEEPLFSWGEKLDDSLSGGPWFDLCSEEVVGIASWEAVEKLSGEPYGFAAPCCWIRAVMDYAKKKGPQDSIFMDRWVNAGMD